MTFEVRTEKMNTQRVSTIEGKTWERGSWGLTGRYVAGRPDTKTLARDLHKRYVGGRDGVEMGSK
jgi:hypothetical protein